MDYQWKKAGVDLGFTIVLSATWSSALFILVRMTIRDHRRFVKGREAHKAYQQDVTEIRTLLDQSYDNPAIREELVIRIRDMAVVNPVWTHVLRLLGESEG